MNFLVNHGKVFKKEIKETKQGTVEYVLVVLFMGFYEEVKVSSAEKYEQFAVGDEVNVAFSPQADKVNKNNKIEINTILATMGIEKAKKSDKVEDLSRIAVSVVSKDKYTSTNDKGEPMQWFRARLDGDVALEIKITEEQYETLKVFATYDVTVLPVKLGRNLICQLINWEFVKDGENKWSL